MIFRLPKEIAFPNPALAEEDGLLAIGGDLSKERLLLAYQNGIFPWFDEESPILWYSPHQRFVLFPHQIRISKSMQQVLNANRFKITFNIAFNDVIKACAETKREDQNGTWITKDMQLAYQNLHLSGYAHSVEVWDQEELVGGLYGVQINKVFCGESMFSRQSNASKCALIWLCQQVDFELIDCQIHSDHLEKLGAKMIERAEFNTHLQAQKT
jgi:leucyl/phenylalanyl-tRNA--protein transferase